MEEEDLHLQLAREGKIAIIWSIGDVQTEREDLNDDQAWEVLQLVKRRADAQVGVNWEMILQTAQELYPKPPEESSDETHAIGDR